MRVAPAAAVALLAAALAGAASAAPASGAALAYVRAVPGAPEIVVAAADGSGRTVARGDDPAWSPDGERLAYARGGRVFVAAADGTGEGAVAAGTAPTWAPDGRRLALAHAGAVWIVATDGSRRRLAAGGEPAWSPRDEIAFARDGDLFTIRSDGTGLTRWTSGAGVDSAPAWDADGQTLAFTRQQAGRIYRFRFVMLATAPGVARKVDTGSDPSWLPGADSLAFSEGGEICLHRAGESGRLTYRLDGTASVKPAWRPGARLARLPPPPPAAHPPACGDRTPVVGLEIGWQHRPTGPRQVIEYYFLVEVTSASLDDVWITADVVGNVEVLKLAASVGFCRYLPAAHVLECHADELAPGQRLLATFRFRPLEPLPALHSSLYAQGDLEGVDDSAYDSDFLACSIGGTDGDDVLVGTAGHDEICGFGGDDTIRGGRHGDWIVGGDGDDRIEGGQGGDRVFGGAGADVLAGGSGKDHLGGGAGDDTLYARDGEADRVWGEEGLDRARVDPGIVDSVYAVERTF